jgi:hypothetical protein
MKVFQLAQQSKFELTPVGMAVQLDGSDLYQVEWSHPSLKDKPTTHTDASLSLLVNHVMPLASFTVPEIMKVSAAFEEDSENDALVALVEKDKTLRFLWERRAEAASLFSSAHARRAAYSQQEPWKRPVQKPE